MANYFIRALNMNPATQTADFYVDGKDAYVIGFDLTSINYTTDENGYDYLVITPSILDSGSDLAEVQAAITQTIYPKNSPSKIAQELVAAKAGI